MKPQTRRMYPVVLGGKPPSIPYSQDFSTNADLTKWTFPGSAAVVGGACVITPTLNGELLTNGNMETWSTPTNAGTWAETLAGASTINREDTVKHAGNYAARYDIDALNSGPSMNQTLGATVTSGCWVRASWWGKTSIAARDEKITISGDATMASQTPGTDYVQLTSVFRTLNAATNLYLSRGTTGTSASLYFDDVSAQKITTSTMRGVRRTGGNTVYKVRVLPAVCTLDIPFGVVGVEDDPTNPQNGVYAFHNGQTTLIMYKRLAGTASNLISLTNVAYNANSKLEIRRSGAVFQLYYGDVQKGTDQTLDAGTDAAILAGRYCGFFSGGPETTIKSVEILPN